MTIRRKFLLTVLPIVLLPLILFWLVFEVSVQPVLDDTEELESNIFELDKLAQTTQEEARVRFETAMREAYAFALANIGANIDGKLDSVEKSLLLSAQRTDLHEYLMDPSSAEQEEQINAYFLDLIETHGLRKVALVDINGYSVLNTVSTVQGAEEPDRSNSRRTRRQILSEPWFVKALQTDSGTSWQLYSEGWRRAEPRNPVVSGVIPIQGKPKGSNPLGYLQLLLPIDSLVAVIQGPDALTSSMRLVDEKGVVQWSRENFDQSEGSEAALFISQVIREGTLSAEVRIPRTKLNENLAPFNSLSAAMARSVMQIEAHSFNLDKTIRNMSVVMFVTKLGLVIVAMFFVWLFLSHVASRIEILHTAANRIREGDLGTALRVKPNGDELESLGKAIETMRQRLQSQIATLDRKVMERTAALAFANRQLKSEIQEKRRAEAEARDANLAKSEFLATMSHEIRTPLNGILGGINLLSHTANGEEQKTLCEIVSNSTKSLNSLVNDILDLAKIEARKIEFTDERFDLANVTKEVVETFSFRANEKGLELKIEDLLQDTLLREGDPQRVKQIIYNLVGNAVKFTESGGVEISLACEKRNPDLVFIEISDTGIGMSQAHVEKIFAPFSQVHGANDSRFGGTGLGLAISKRLAEQMDGAIEVKSELGVGSTFRVSLKLPMSIGKRDDEPSTGDNVDGPLEAVQALGSILLAEDNETNCLIMEKVLRLAGFEVSTVNDGVECLRAVESESYDLILMDCSMPNMDGCEATTAIRNSGSGFSDVAIMGITANATSDQQQRCKEAGMNDLLFKPVDSEILVETCKRLIRQDSA